MKNIEKINLYHYLKQVFITLIFDETRKSQSTFHSCITVHAKLHNNNFFQEEANSF